MHRPASWSTSFVPSAELTLRLGRGDASKNGSSHAGEEETKPEAAELERRWVQVGKVWDFPADGGAAVKYSHTQIAVFNFTSRGEWYATQNMCPHRREFVLSRGLVGDQKGTPKVSCPVHKKNFSLASGKCISGEDFSLEVFRVRVDGDDVYLYLPPPEVLDALLATEKTCNGACHTEPSLQKPKLPSRKAKVMDPFAVSPLGDPI